MLIGNKFHNPMIPKPKTKRIVVVEDYLLKQRIRRQDEQEEEPLHRKGFNWQNISADDVTDTEK